VTEEDIARHESGHACAAVLLGIPVTAARIERTPDGRPWGFISYPDLLAEIDKKRVRDIAVMTMCGPIMEGRDLPSWPPSRDAYHQDERHMACYADYLGLDEAGWYGLRAEAYRLTATDEFCHLWEATTGLLERCVQL
jgi:hypothetical protein